MPKPCGGYWMATPGERVATESAGGFAPHPGTPHPGAPRSVGSRVELLLFSLGLDELFGVNVCKVREVLRAPALTRASYLPYGVDGLLALRGHILPAVNLARLTGLGDPDRAPALVVAEFSRHLLAFLVADVERIVRVDGEDVAAASSALAGDDAWLSALTRLPDGRLVSVLDVERVLAAVTAPGTAQPVSPPGALGSPTGSQDRAAGDGGRDERLVFFADDSSVARREIQGVLDHLGLPHQHAADGREAWERLTGLAGRHLQDLRGRLRLILVDAEMPRMDGYALTRAINADVRFAGIPVVMHSSLSSGANRDLGRQAGADAYVTKFDPDVLAQTLTLQLRHRPAA